MIPTAAPPVHAPTHRPDMAALRSVAAGVVELAERIEHYPADRIAVGTVCRAYVVLDAIRDQLAEVEAALLVADLDQQPSRDWPARNEQLHRVRDRARGLVGVGVVQTSALLARKG
jgi:hypothetical protein